MAVNPNPPTFCYLAGTAQNLAGLQQGITTALLDVASGNTVTSGAISAGTATVTCTSTTNVGVGSVLWINYGLSDQEMVTVTAVPGAGSFTATFENSHSASATVKCTFTAQATPYTSTWTAVTTGTPPSGLNASMAFLSQADTNPSLSADVTWTPLMFGVGSGANSMGVATADDVDFTQSPWVFKNITNYYSAGSQTSIASTFAASAFSWYGVFTEFGFVVVAIIGTSPVWLSGGTLRPWRPLNQRGVGNTVGALTGGSTSAVVTPDISARIQTGQKIMLVNNSHSHSSTNFSAINVVVTVSTVSAATPTTGECTIHFTGSITGAGGTGFDTGALIGGIIPNVVSAGAPDNSQFYASHNADGSYTASAQGVGNSMSPDSGVLTAAMGSDSAPTTVDQLWAGELDIPIYDTTVGYKGQIGFLYGCQVFAPGSPVAVANLDVFGDGGNQFVWKAFLSTLACALGPISNPLNTATLNWTPTNPPPFLP
jgi:hypothetical protein